MKLKKFGMALVGLCMLGSVSAQTLAINAAGSSTSREVFVKAIIESGCGASNITWYQADTNVTRIICPIIGTRLQFLLSSSFTHLDFNYDNTRDSYMGIGPVSGNGETMRRVHIGSGTRCGYADNIYVAGKTVRIRPDCGTEAIGVRPTIGSAEVEPDMFIGALAPAHTRPLIPDGIGHVEGQYGVIYGVAVSLPLYRALQSEQGLAQTDEEVTAPTLTTSQIVSLSTANGGPLNSNWQALFPNTSASNPNVTQPVRFIRRVAGAGSHASFASHFLATNCTAKNLIPAADADSSATFRVLEYRETANQIAGIDSVGPFPTVTAPLGSTNARALNGTAKPANYYAMGYASLENAPAARGNSSGWRFVKVDGLYPSKANVQKGRYNWMAEKVMTRANLDGGATNFGVSAASLDGVYGFFEFLVFATGSAASIAELSLPERDGRVALPGVADSSEANYPAQRTRFRTFGNSCVRPFATE